ELLQTAAAAAAALPGSAGERVALVKGDLFDTSLWVGDAGRRPDFIFLYLLHAALQQLRPLLEPLILEGSVVCSLGWEIAGWEPECNAQ
ncbi:unnamed protein product, partial [Polarella glacialis]